mmetsp:Transcript_16047/g.20324  ORF Transcript_16047/g.20324 Transcript_16047/m.20324 type:complete len:112 (-) Transcript_16047:742-1077(-)
MLQRQNTRQSLVLNQSINLHTQFDPLKFENDAYGSLGQKSKTFLLNGMHHRYDHMDRIFFLSGPVPEDERHQIKKCPACHHQFAKSKEMVFCSFCGYSCDEKCVRKTREYP